jgi:hypothetical protein
LVKKRQTPIKGEIATIERIIGSLAFGANTEWDQEPLSDCRDRQLEYPHEKPFNPILGGL